jgi:hypothetical protein
MENLAKKCFKNVEFFTDKAANLIYDLVNAGKMGQRKAEGWLLTNFHDCTMLETDIGLVSVSVEKIWEITDFKTISDFNFNFFRHKVLIDYLNRNGEIIFFIEILDHKIEVLDQPDEIQEITALFSNCNI